MTYYAAQRVTTFYGETSNRKDPGTIIDAALETYYLDTAIQDFSTKTSMSDGHPGTVKGLYAAKVEGQKATLGVSFQRAPMLVASKIANLCEILVLPLPVVVTVLQLYKRAYDEAVFPLRTPLDGILAACIYVGCKTARVPRTMQELARAMRVTKKELGRRYIAMDKLFQSRPCSKKDNDAGYVVKPQDLIPRFCNHLGIATSTGVEAIAVDVVVRATEICHLEVRRSATVAAVAIYFACALARIDKGMKEICEACGIKKDTGLGLYRALYAERERLVKTDELEEGKARLDLLPRPRTKALPAQ